MTILSCQECQFNFKMISFHTISKAFFINLRKKSVNMLCTSVIRKSQYLKCICQCQRNCNFHWILSNAYPNRRESLASFPFQEKVFKCVRILPRLITSLLFLQHPKRKVYTNMNIFFYFLWDLQAYF